jgi:hypothetical protein
VNHVLPNPEQKQRAFELAWLAASLEGYSRVVGIRMIGYAAYARRLLT